jgi:hypothetical protein
MYQVYYKCCKDLQEDRDNFSNSVRNDVKAAGLMDTPDNCWEFFIDKVNDALSFVTTKDHIWVQA